MPILLYTLSLFIEKELEKGYNTKRSEVENGGKRTRNREKVTNS